MKTQERNYQLDIIRVIACLMVIALHAPQRGLNYSGVFLVANSMLVEPCIGLFFMVSGFLLLPVKLSYVDFIKKRFSKVLWPTLFFSTAYTILNGLTFNKEWGGVITHLLSIPFSCQGSKVLWFMYSLLGIYFIAPIISPFLEKAAKKEIHAILVLWLISLTTKTLSNYLYVTNNEESLFYYFYGYCGYSILGFYFRKYPIRIPIYVFPVLIIVPFVTCFLDHIYNLHIETWYLSVFCVMQCVAWFQFVLQYINLDKWPLTIKNVLSNFSDCSFGIYLIHTFPLFYVLWNIPMFIDAWPIIRFLANFLLTVLSSWIIAYLISKTCIGQYLIGYQSKRLFKLLSFNRHKHN